MSIFAKQKNKIMKTKKHFFSLLLMFLLVFAADSFSYSILNLSSYDGSRFYVEFNKDKISVPAYEFETGNVNSGRHYLRVYAESVSPGRTGSAIFSDYIVLPDGYKIYAVIDEYGKFLVYKKISTNNAFLTETRCNCNCECCKNCPKCSNVPIPGNYDEEWNCQYNIMSDGEFNGLKNSIEKVSFESSKKELIEMAALSNEFSSRQVKELLQMLSFENSKLELAKILYPRTCDKNNYYTVADVFSFESSYMDLKKFIEQNK